MNIFIALYIFALVCSSLSKPAPEESVVSDYTTERNASSVDVYRQIANNLVERISAPFHRFFDTQRNKTNTGVVTRNALKVWQNLEPLDESAQKPRKSNTDDNEILERDVEELSVEALNKIDDKKPEKISLLHYLPVNEHLEVVEMNNTDDFQDITFDEVEPTGRVEGPFIFLLELIGSFIQLLTGAISALFSPKPSSSGDSN